MAIAGLGSAWGIGMETVYGTPVATTVTLPFQGESISTVNNPINPPTLWPGQVITPDSQFRVGAAQHSGTIESLAYTKGQEELWRAAFGGYSFLTDTHTFTPAVFTESQTHAFGYGGTTSVPSKQYDGGVCTGWTLNASAGEAITFSTDWVYQGLTLADSDTIAGSTPASMAILTWADVATLTIGGQGFDCVSEVTITADNGYATDRLCLGSAEIADPRVYGAGGRTITGELMIDFEDFSTATPEVVEDFINGAAAQAFSMTIVKSSATYTFSGQVRVLGSVPNISDLDIVRFPVPVVFTADTGDDTAALTMTLNNGTTTL